MDTATANKPPRPHLSEIVLKTKRYQEMRDWYATFLDTEPGVERDRPEKASWTGAMSIAFFQLVDDFPYMQVLGVFEVDDTELTPGTDPGLHHSQFMHTTLDELFDNFDRLKAAGLNPAQTWNHGPVTSFYYEDPDGNLMEITAANYPTKEEFFGYFQTEAYKQNISGIPIDAEAYIAKYRDGMSREDLVLIPV